MANMNCAHCRTPMLVLELDQIEVDYCLVCGGIWLDSGELDILFEDPKEAAALQSQLSQNSPVDKSKRKCPICRRKMNSIKAGLNSKVELDQCRHRHGIWFDRGELPSIIKEFDFDKNNKIATLLTAMFESR